MRERRLLSCASVLLLLVGPAFAGQTKPATPPSSSGSSLARLPPPVRGEAELGYLTPQTKRSGGEIVTIIKIKNLSETNSIVGLKVDEFWYDRAGEPVTGDTYRHRKPLLPLEVIDVTLRTPTNPKMDRNQYKFEHSNGTIKATQMKEL